MSGWLIWDIIAVFLLPLLALITFLITKGMIVKQLKKNPPISEAQIRAMYASTGKAPSDAQVQGTIRAMKQAKAKAALERKNRR